MPAGPRIHTKGLKYGLYSDRGFRTCQGFPGLLDNEVVDAKTMAGLGTGLGWAEVGA